MRRLRIGAPAARLLQRAKAGTLNSTDMTIGIATYRTMSLVVLAMFIAAVALATVRRWSDAGIALGVLVVVVVTQAALLQCQHCGTRPGLWLLAFWTVLFSPGVARRSTSR